MCVCVCVLLSCKDEQREHLHISIKRKDNRSAVELQLDETSDSSPHQCAVLRQNNRATVSLCVTTRLL